MYRVFLRLKNAKLFPFRFSIFFMAKQKDFGMVTVHYICGNRLFPLSNFSAIHAHHHCPLSCVFTRNKNHFFLDDTRIYKIILLSRADI